MNDAFEEFEHDYEEYTNEELQRIDKAVREIDSAVVDCIVDLNKDIHDSGVWNSIMAFYLIAHADKVNVEAETNLKALYAQIQSFKGEFQP